MKGTITMRFSRTLTAALAVICLGLSLASCKVTIKPGENGLYDSKNDIRYVNASMVYEARELGEEYGVLKLTENESYKLYRIPGVESNRLLATEDLNIVHASDLKMPTLSEMKPTVIRICMATDSAVYEIDSLTEKKSIDRVVTAYENAPALKNPGYTPVRNLIVRFESPDHPGFYYTLTYAEYAQDIEIDGESYGRYFLVSRFEDIFAPIDDAIHQVLGEIETEEADTASSPA